MLTLQKSSAKIKSRVPVEGNKSLLLICSAAELVGSISRLLSRCPLKPQHCMSYLGLISVCPPREGSMAAGPSPTPDRPLLGFPLPTLLACFLSCSRFLLAANVTGFLGFKGGVRNFWMTKELSLLEEKLKVELEFERKTTFNFANLSPLFGKLEISIEDMLLTSGPLHWEKGLH